MTPRFHNAHTNRLEELRPASPPRVDILWHGERGLGAATLGLFRARTFLSVLVDALTYLGLSPRVGEPSGGSPDLYCGEAAPPGARCWIRLGLGAGEEEALEAVKGLDEAELRLLCLRTHYRQPLSLSRPALDSAREDLAFVRAACARLQAGHGSSAPNPTGLAGYKKRLRDALADDLDTPAALAAVLDALRPGALSPGSQLGALKDAEKALRLHLFLGKNNRH